MPGVMGEWVGVFRWVLLLVWEPVWCKIDCDGGGRLVLEIGRKNTHVGRVNENRRSSLWCH
jgi:hypothetical protein